MIGASMEGDGSIHFVVEEASNGGTLTWKVVHRMSDALTSCRSGNANRFDEAVEAAISAKLVSVEHAGLVWFEHMRDMDPGWITEAGGQAVQVWQVPSGRWRWRHSVSPSSTEGQICSLADPHWVASPTLAGESASLEEAAQVRSIPVASEGLSPSAFGRQPTMRRGVAMESKRQSAPWSCSRRVDANGVGGAELHGYLQDVFTRIADHPSTASTSCCPGTSPRQRRSVELPDVDALVDNRTGIRRRTRRHRGSHDRRARRRIEPAALQAQGAHRRHARRPTANDGTCASLHLAHAVRCVNFCTGQLR